MPVPTTDLITWLAGLGWDTTQESGSPIVPGPYIPDTPDRLVILTPIPGPGYQRDGATDLCGFQLRTRGPQGGDGSPHALAAAERDAYALDALILNAAYPAVLPSGQVLVIMRRLSSAPALMSGMPDDGDRYSLTASYLAEVSN